MREKCRLSAGNSILFHGSRKGIQQGSERNDNKMDMCKSGVNEWFVLAAVSVYEGTS